MTGLGFTVYLRYPGTDYVASGWSERREDAESYAAEEIRFAQSQGRIIVAKIEPAGGEIPRPPSTQTDAMEHGTHSDAEEGNEQT